MSFSEVINYELVDGNAAWRFVAVLLVVLIVLIVGKIFQFFLANFAAKKAAKTQDSVLAMFVNTLSKPMSLAFFVIAVQLSRACLIFDNPDTETVEGIRNIFANGWDKIIQMLWAITLAYAIYRLVDIIEHYIYKFVSKTSTKLDDMLVPMVRKSLRITIAIIATLLIAENIFGREKIGSLLLSAGVGGIAIALAAKDTIANFFGSLTIFADRPFQVDDLIKVDDYLGTIEEVGFRSTKMRTLQGHQIIIPNNTIANANIENIARRPYIRRTTSITITYDSGYEKVQRAVDIIKNILADTPQVNKLPKTPPRVYFNEFGSHSLDIYMSYWAVPSDYWLCKELDEKINFRILKQFDDEGIEFAFPTQTLYVKKPDKNT